MSCCSRGPWPSSSAGTASGSTRSAPGYIQTALNAQIAGQLGGEDFAQRYARDNVPLGRTGQPEEVAAAYAFLASDDASFLSGTGLVVDGGQLAVM